MAGTPLIGAKPICQLINWVRFARLQSGTGAHVGFWLLAFPIASLAADLNPPEVAAYLERRELCEHFRSEPWPEGSSPTDKERRLFLARQFERYCKGSDEGLRELKRKYKDDRAVIERLDKYEADIEARP